MNTQQLLSILLVFLLAAPVPVCAQQTVDRVQILKAKIIEIPAGSVVSVKMLDKKNLRGKLGPVSDSGFELQTVNGGKIENQALRFDSVRTVKYHEKGMSTGAKITLGVLAGVGAVAVVLIVVAATMWGD